MGEERAIMDRIQVSRKGEVLGEYTPEELEKAIGEGTLRPDDHYWTKGMAGWELLGHRKRPGAGAPADPTVSRHFWRRAQAALIDWPMLGLMDAIIMYFTLLPVMKSWSLGVDFPWGVFLQACARGFGWLMLFNYIYCACFWLLFRGTPGQLLRGLRLVTLSGRRVDPLRALARFLVGIISFLSLPLCHLLIFKTRHRQTLHDKAAGTKVIEIGPSES